MNSLVNPPELQPGEVLAFASPMFAYKGGIWIVLKPDGSYVTIDDAELPGGSYYIHLWGLPPDFSPTEAQKKTVSQWFLCPETRPGVRPECKDDLNKGYCTGETIQSWAFQGMTMDEVEKLTEVGKKVYYA